MDISDRIEAVLADTQLKSTYNFRNVLRFFPPPLFFVVLIRLSTPLTVNSLDKLHAKHALPGFTDRSAEEREIEAITADITSVNLALPFSRLTVLQVG